MRLTGRYAVVVGASRGVGRAGALTLAREGADVLAIARRQPDLVDIKRAQGSIRTHAMDAADESTVVSVTEAGQPDLLVICAGTVPPLRPMQEQNFDEFSRNRNVDVRASFNFCAYALRAPLAAGSLVVLVSSGAALSGSPLSGGHAGAKRMQMFMARYYQRESERLALGIRFVALAPMRMMPNTGGGDAAIGRDMPSRRQRALGRRAVERRRRFEEPVKMLFATH